jgi:L-ribulose-5-phosphate 3-epimerase UlaE
MGAGTPEGSRYSSSLDYSEDKGIRLTRDEQDEFLKKLHPPIPQSPQNINGVATTSKRRFPFGIWLKRK